MNMCSYQDTWTGRAALPLGFDSDRLRAADRGAGVIGAHPVLLRLQDKHCQIIQESTYAFFSKISLYTIIFP